MRPSLFLLDTVRRYIPPIQRPHRFPKALWNLIGHLRIRIIGDPKVVKNQAIKKALSEMPKEGYYAVHTGYQPGIYRTWPEAEAQVKGYPAAKFKKFPTEAAAETYMQGSSAPPYSLPNRSTALGQSSRSTTSAPNRQATSATSHTRASSPPTSIDPQHLPPDLQAIAKQGYTFSKDKRLVVYTDGSGLSNGKVGARAGLGVYWGSERHAGKRNLSERVSGDLQTNNRGELLSVIRALELCPYPSIPLEIRTDSQYTISCMTTFLPKWLKTNFRLSTKSNPYKPKSDPWENSNDGNAGRGQEVKNADLIKHLLVLLRRRDPKAGVRFKHVAAHVGFEGNEAADRLAKAGAILPPVPERTDYLDPERDSDLPVLTSDTVESGPIDIDVEVDPSWLLTEEEMKALEKDFQLED